MGAHAVDNVPMKKLLFTLALLPALAHARYEDLFGDEGPGELADINLPIYLGAGLIAWLWLSWGEGWRMRWMPLSLAAAAVIAGFGWGMDGLGVVAVLTFPVGLYALTQIKS